MGCILDPLVGSFVNWLLVNISGLGRATGSKFNTLVESAWWLYGCPVVYPYICPYVQSHDFRKVVHLDVSSTRFKLMLGK